MYPGFKASRRQRYSKKKRGLVTKLGKFANVGCYREWFPAHKCLEPLSRSANFLTNALGAPTTHQSEGCSSVS